MLYIRFSALYCANIFSRSRRLTKHKSRDYLRNAFATVLVNHINYNRKIRICCNENRQQRRRWHFCFIFASPLYTAQTFLAGQGGLQNINRATIYGMLSLLFWSITLITTVKYVFVAMRTDNKGEGGIFALYSLLRKKGAWLAIPAMIGGAAFLADSVLTPAVSISSAVEGLRTIAVFKPIFLENENLSMMITVIIIVILFSVQQRGTERIGKVFGIVVMLWFAFLALVGVMNIGQDWTIFEALNPIHGIKFLFNVQGLAVMGVIFLSTTGA